MCGETFACRTVPGPVDFLPWIRRRGAVHLNPLGASFGSPFFLGSPGKAHALDGALIYKRDVRDCLLHGKGGLRASLPRIDSRARTVLGRRRCPSPLPLGSTPRWCARDRTRRTRCRAEGLRRNVCVKLLAQVHREYPADLLRPWTLG